MATHEVKIFAIEKEIRELKETKRILESDQESKENEIECLKGQITEIESKIKETNEHLAFYQNKYVLLNTEEE